MSQMSQKEIIENLQNNEDVIMISDGQDEFIKLLRNIDKNVSILATGTKRKREDDEDIPVKRRKLFGFDINEEINVKYFEKSEDHFKVKYKKAIVKADLDDYVYEAIRNKKYSFILNKGYLKLELGISNSMYELL